jgi:hypothetical protein
MLAVARVVEREVLADRIRVAPLLPSERLVDDDDTGRVRRVALVEVAPGAQRNAHRSEIVRATYTKFGNIGPHGTTRG